jgi:hypothetical protein
MALHNERRQTLAVEVRCVYCEVGLASLRMDNLGEFRHNPPPATADWKVSLHTEDPETISIKFYLFFFLSPTAKR